MNYSNMRVNILLFGITKDIIGKQKLQLDLPDFSTVGDFKDVLSQSYPELNDLNSIAVAVNNEYANDGMLIQSQDEIALIPPVSGG